MEPLTLSGKRPLGPKVPEFALLSAAEVILAGSSHAAVPPNSTMKSRRLGSVGMVLGNLGLDRAPRHDFRSAIKFYEQNLAIARRIGNRTGDGAVLGSLGGL